MYITNIYTLKCQISEIRKFKYTQNCTFWQIAKISTFTVSWLGMLPKCNRQRKLVDTDHDSKYLNFVFPGVNKTCPYHILNSICMENIK